MLCQWTECNICSVFGKQVKGATSKALLNNRNILYVVQSLTHHIPCDEAWQCVSSYQHCIAILHVHQSLLRRLRNTPTKIATHTNDCKYSWVRLRVHAALIAVLVSSIASTRKCNCKYSRVRLHVLASILKFNAREFRLACGQCIARVCSLTLQFDARLWYCKWHKSLTFVC